MMGIKCGIARYGQPPACAFDADHTGWHEWDPHLGEPCNASHYGLGPACVLPGRHPGDHQTGTDEPWPQTSQE
jgi:hypothetical protein